MGRSPSPARRRKDKHRDRIKHRKRSRSRDKSRSRSPVDRRRKERRYSRSPIERSRRTSRSRSRSYERDRKRSPGPSSHKVSKASRATSSKNDFEGAQTMDEQEIAKMMGFSGFSSTKGKKVDGNDVGEVHVILKRKYRQYMNRKGGFNRPLDFVA